MKRIFLNIFVILVCLLVTSACTGKDGAFDIRKPYALDLTPPDGPPEYQQGWSDGCESGSHAYSSGVYKVLGAFELKQDPVLRNNRMYYQVWKDAFLYCSLYWEGINRMGL